MIETNRDLLQSVSHIRLSGFAILQARVVGQWLTILAYCGNCGKWPIFLGRTDATAQHDRPGTGSCRSCPCNSGRLVCNECGSCSGIRCRQGIPYADAREAQAAAQGFPGWRQVGKILYPPDPDETMQLHA